MFPMPDTVYPNGQVQPGSYGCSVRVWLVGQALAGICANPELATWDANTIGKEAVHQADATIKALGL